jgi:hypothetical protein
MDHISDFKLVYNCLANKPLCTRAMLIKKNRAL